MLTILDDNDCFNAGNDKNDNDSHEELYLLK